MSLLDNLVEKIRKDLSHAVELCDAIQNNRHPHHHKNLDDLKKSLSEGPSFVLREANKAKDLLGVDVARGDDIARTEFTSYTTEVESINAILKTISHPHDHYGVEHPHFCDLRLKWEKVRDKITETFAKLVYRLEVKEKEERGRKEKEEKERKEKERKEKERKEKERKEKEEKERKEKEEKERKKREEKERKDKDEKERKEREVKERKERKEKEEKERKKREEKERKEREEKERKETKEKEEKERKKREEKERKDKEEKERKKREEKERKEREETERKEREEKEEIKRKAKEDEFKEIERVAELLGKFQGATSRTAHP